MTSGAAEISSAPRAARGAGDSAAVPPASGLRLALAGGGTGGHLLPGRHLLAHALRSGEAALADLLWFTSGREVEDRALAGLEAELGAVPYERVVLGVEPPGGGAPSRLRLARATPRAFAAARAALRRHRSEVLLGLGGFTTLPPVLAARSLGIPVLLLEVNAVPGAATRVLAPLARRVLHAFRSGVPGAGARHLFVGPLLPPGLGAGSEVDAGGARAALALEARHPLLLVLGGSQGAGSLNAFARAHAAGWCAAGLQVLHQTGPTRLHEGAPPMPGYRAFEFSTEVPRLLRAATLVLCRGGASTLLEVAAAGAPALVVPYPHAAGRHQHHNARELGEGVRVVEDAELDEPLARELVRLCGEAGARERAAMRAALRAAVPLDGAERALDLLRGARRSRPGGA